MSRYRYEPLNSDADEARLLTLLPGRKSEQVRVEIEIVSLTKGTELRYEALSYVWGSTDDLKFIMVGSAGDVTHSVTQNLATALPHLRYARYVFRNRTYLVVSAFRN